MARVVAITDIHRTTAPGRNKTADSPAVKPVVKVIKAGTFFVTNEAPREDHPKGYSEHQELLELKAIRVPAKGETAVISHEHMPTEAVDRPAAIVEAKTGRKGRKAAAAAPGDGDGDGSGNNDESGDGDGSNLV